MREVFALAAVALLLATRTVSAANPPEMMEGLWSIHSQSVDNPGNKETELTSTLCRSHAYDGHVLEFAKTTNHCTITQSVEASRYSVTTHCIVAETVVASTSTAIYMGNTAARSETHVSYKPALGGISEVTMVQDEKYVGNCPADSRPADLTRAGESVVHLWGH